MAAGLLVSLNVGKPRDIEWQGRTVHTGIWKSAVEGPRMVRRLNVDGDGQGDLNAHGGEHRAVFVYQLDSYRYWENHLGRDDFVHGQFGENFTVDGLADEEVHIGDRFRIGAAEFEVTQPRVTCYRLGMRMDEVRMPSLVVSHHRPGFYLRVLKEGEVEAGDAIEQIDAGPEQMSVADIDALLYLPGRRRADLHRALRIPALSSGWRGSFEALLAPPAATPADEAAWPGFRQMTVAAVEPESETIKSFWLRPAEEAPGLTARPGQYLTLRVPTDPPLVRSYSLSAPPGPRGYRISVKRDGAASRWLHEHLSAGATLEVAAPRGAFVLADQHERPVVLMSAGVGATPVLAMLHALAAGTSDQPVWWIHTAHDERQYAFGAEADDLLKQLPHAQRFVAFKRLTPAVLDELSPPVDADYYLCGPDAFMDGVSAALVARGVLPERVHTERFGAVEVTASGVVATDRPPPHAPAGPPGTGPLVSFARSGLTVPWPDGEASLLDLAEACDVPANFGCRIGVCHNCHAALLSGEYRYAQEPLDPPEHETVLLCCAVPEGELVIDL